MKKIHLRKHEEKRLLSGHQWAFSNELLDAPKTIDAGDVVHLYAHDQKFIGAGFFNPHSLIAFRLLSREDEPIDAAFFEKRFLTALRLRQKLYPASATNTFRLVHAESDGLSGLVIDKFGDVLSVQTFSAGMEKLLDTICSVLKKLFSPSAIVIRNESELRKLEGLEQYQRVAHGKVDGAVEIYDANIRYLVDVLHGHKTGFFLDQRENRKRIRPFAKNADVLDVFTSDGGFALNALHAGGKSALAIDASKDALRRAAANAERNDYTGLQTLDGDAFELLEELHRAGKQFDLVILDPPSLTKSKKTTSTAMQAYRKLNRLGLSLVKSGGFFATASCSHHVAEDEFFAAVGRASLDVKREIQLLEKSGQAPDHPVLLAMPETCYLKLGLFAVR